MNPLMQLLLWIKIMSFYQEGVFLRKRPRVLFLFLVLSFLQISQKSFLPKKIIQWDVMAVLAPVKDLVEIRVASVVIQHVKLIVHKLVEPPVKVEVMASDFF